MQIRMRCYDVSEGREAIEVDGEDSGRTRVVSLTVSFWDDDLPKNVHTDRKRTCAFTTMKPEEFDQFVKGKFYNITIEAG